MKTDEFMNDKKSHEVQVMSQLVDSIADFYGIKQVSIFFIVIQYLFYSNCYPFYHLIQSPYFDISLMPILVFILIIRTSS